MAENMTDYEEQREKMAEVAMQIILHAGDARELVLKALDLAGEEKYEEAEKNLLEAKEELRQAHAAQTGIVQSEAAGTRYEYSLLFCHAQDTVMTIFSEMNIAKKVIALQKKTDERIRNLAQKAGER